MLTVGLIGAYDPMLGPNPVPGQVVIMGQRRQTRKKRSTFSPWCVTFLLFFFSSLFLSSTALAALVG